MFDDEIDALNHLLENGYKQKAGLLYHPDIFHEETREDSEAIDYLCREWDYGWSWVPYEEKS